MTITINGIPCECEKGEFILQVARRNGIEIPTLCHHDGFAGQGSCRLCIVEVIEGGRAKVVVSCVYPIGQECEVLTDSAKIRRQRGMILALLQKRAPESEEIAALCEKYRAPVMERFVQTEGAISVSDQTRQGSRAEWDQRMKCVLCGLCVKACAELSVGAISTVNRGVIKEIATPYHEPSSVCVGCGSCAYVCPTNAISVTETEDTRTIWGKTFSLVRCRCCGAVIGTREELAYSSEKSGLEPDTLCAECRKKQIAESFRHTFG